MTDIATIGADFFAPHVGGTVALADGAGNVLLTAELQAAKEEPRATLPGIRTAFSLSLVAAAPCTVESGSYILAHPDFGSIGPLHVERTFPGALVTDQAWFRIYFN